MEGRPALIPASPEEKKAELKKKLDEHQARIQERIAHNQKKKDSEQLVPKVSTEKSTVLRPALELDAKRKAAGEGAEHELTLDENGKWVYKEFKND